MHVLVSDAVWKTEKSWALSLFRLFLYSPHACPSLPSPRFLSDNITLLQEQFKNKKVATGGGGGGGGGWGFSALWGGRGGAGGGGNGVFSSPEYLEQSEELYFQFLTAVYESLLGSLPSLSVSSPCSLPQWGVKIHRPLQKEQRFFFFFFFFFFKYCYYFLSF